MIDFKLLIDKALKLGFTDVEIVEQNSTSLEISLYESKIEQNKLSSNNSFTIRAIYEEKMVSIRVEDFEIDFDELLNRLKQNVLSIESEEKNEIYAGDELYPTVEKNEYDFDAIPTSKKIDFLLEMEKKCKELDERVVKVSDCVYEEFDSKYHIINSKGLDIVKYKKYCTAVVGVVAVENGSTQDEYHFSTKKSFEEQNANEIASKAVEKAVAKFNAKPIKITEIP